MNIKRFTAESSREALRMVKKEMGPDAVILGTRTLRPAKSGLQGGSQRVEVTAAVDYAPQEASPRNDGGRDSLSQTAMMERWEILEKELRDIKAALLSAEAGRGLSPELYYDQAVRSLYGHFQTFGLRHDIIEDVLCEFYRGKRRKNALSETELLQESLSRILRRIPMAVPENRPGRREICTFIGPTGVGKTTTLAKLAALRAVKQGVSTALITLDTFRIAAVSQLQTYGRIMDIPLHVASGRIELDEALRKSRDADLILIDTAGRSPNRDEDIRELVRLLGDREDFHHFLVLSATTDYENLLRAREQFGRIPFKGYIFTKLDEVRNISAVLNFLVSRRRPVSFFTTGQQVPEDIEVASRKRLAKLMLGMSRTAAERQPAGVNEGKDDGSGNRTQILDRGSYGRG